jgi:hypothetical protein
LICLESFLGERLFFLACSSFKFVKTEILLFFAPGDLIGCIIKSGLFTRFLIFDSSLLMLGNLLGGFGGGDTISSYFNESLCLTFLQRIQQLTYFLGDMALMFFISLIKVSFGSVSFGLLQKQLLFYKRRIEQLIFISKLKFYV